MEVIDLPKRDQVSPETHTQVLRTLNQTNDHRAEEIRKSFLDTGTQLTSTWA